MCEQQPASSVLVTAVVPLNFEYRFWGREGNTDSLLTIAHHNCCCCCYCCFLLCCCTLVLSVAAKTCHTASLEFQQTRCWQQRCRPRRQQRFGARIYPIRGRISQSVQTNTINLSPVASPVYHRFVHGAVGADRVQPCVSCYVNSQCCRRIGCCSIGFGDSRDGKGR
eukprot:SAG31_NODE_237_length_19590_cov_13.149915_13_plen_167_part_00